jgi:hypothetical protein
LFSISLKRYTTRFTLDTEGLSLKKFSLKNLRKNNTRLTWEEVKTVEMKTKIFKFGAQRFKFPYMIIQAEDKKYKISLFGLGEASQNNKSQMDDIEKNLKEEILNYSQHSILLK